jgi:hypothetical protein
MVYLEIKVCDFILASQIGLVHIQEAAATPTISGMRGVSLLHTLLNEDNKYISHKELLYIYYLDK